jgi:hypothetical protein
MWPDLRATEVEKREKACAASEGFSLRSQVVPGGISRPLFM